MSAIVTTRQVIEERLTTLGLPIAYENVAFTPQVDQKYLMVQFVNQSTTDPVLGDKYYRENIQLQIFVCDVLGQGSTSALNSAEAVRALFPKGWSNTSGGYKINIFSTPRIAGAVSATDRFVVPCLIDLVVEVYL